MESYLGLDVHAASCTLAVISQTGRRLKDFPVETNGQALVEAIRMIPGRKRLVFEEGLQSAWLYETLSPLVDETVVAGITESRGPKSDKRNAYGLAEKLRVGDLEKHVFKAPRQFTRLRELSRIHMTLVGDVVRAQARIKSLYRSRGILVSGMNVYGVRPREGWQKQRCSSAQTRATRLYDHLDFLLEQKKQAEVELARGQSAVEVAWKLGITEQTYYRWRKEFGGLRIDQAKRLKELEKENVRLKKLVADQALDNAILKETASGKF
jgi:hypothetical protein